MNETPRKKAGAIITNRGGRTCHAAIIARELGIPAIVGCGDATDKVKKGRGGSRNGRKLRKIRGKYEEHMGKLYRKSRGKIIQEYITNYDQIMTTNHHQPLGF